MRTDFEAAGGIDFLMIEQYLPQHMLFLDAPPIKSWGLLFLPLESKWVVTGRSKITWLWGLAIRDNSFLPLSLGCSPLESRHWAVESKQPHEEAMYRAPSHGLSWDPRQQLASTARQVSKQASQLLTPVSSQLRPQMLWNKDKLSPLFPSFLNSWFSESMSLTKKFFMALSLG